MNRRDRRHRNVICLTYDEHLAVWPRQALPMTAMTAITCDVGDIFGWAARIRT